MYCNKQFKLNKIFHKARDLVNFSNINTSLLSLVKRVKKTNIHVLSYKIYSVKRDHLEAGNVLNESSTADLVL